jgi:hypothetical protein
VGRALPRAAQSQALGLSAAHGHARRSCWASIAAEQAVIDAWREYLDKLSTKVADEAELVVWSAQRDELFTNLLFAIAKNVRYVTVKREKTAT